MAMALSAMSGTEEFESTKNQRFSFVNFSKLLNLIKNETARLQVQNVLTAMYELILEFIQLQEERGDLRNKINSCNCIELQKKIDAKNTMLEALGSTIVKLKETRNLDVYLPEAYRILSTDTVLLTPPSDSPKTSEPTSAENPEPCLDQNNMNNKTAQRKAKNNKSKTQNGPDEEHLDLKVIKKEKLSQNPTEEKQIKESVLNLSSDVSIEDESMTEIHGTPAGRTSPIIGLRAKRNRKICQDLKNFESGSPKGKLNLSGASPQRKASRRTKQTKLNFRLPLKLIKPSVTVDLTSSSAFGGGVRDSRNKSPINRQLDSMRMSTEDDDVIQPSPTSETVKNTFGNTRSRIGERSSVLPPPHLTSQDETHLMITSGIDFDEPMDTETGADDSVNLLRGVIKCEPSSPVLCENRNACNVTPVKCDTDVSVSVLDRRRLRPFARLRAARENQGPNAAASDRRSPTMRSPKKELPAVTDNSVTQCDAAENYYDVKHNAKKAPERKPELENPVHIYKEDVVRKKADKMKLPGWICEDCKNYYGDIYKGDEAKLRELLDKCSKHRAKMNPARQLTPPGFWDVHLSVPEDTEALNRLNNVS